MKLMQRDSLLKQLKIYEDQFQYFMGIQKFPVYELQTKEASKSTADIRGFEVVVSASYEPQNKRHTLLVSTNSILMRYLIFHEFTHILDSEMYVKGDKARYAGISGFTEYHASQVELVELLGADTIEEVPLFSMNTNINVLAGEKSVHQYVEKNIGMQLNYLVELIFPADLETLKSAIGILYNYFGIRSICEEYSIDYKENENNTAFLKYIPTQLFSILNGLMHGWLDEEKIELSINVYINIILPLIKEFRLA